MTHDEYIEKLTELKKKAEKAVVSKLPAVEKQALDILRDFIDENLDTKNGDFVANDRAVKAIDDFTDTYLKAVTELKDYKGMVGQYLKNFKDVDTLMEEFQTSNGVNVKQAKLGAVQELVTAEILNRYSENGLNPGFVQPLRELLFNNITGGLNKKQAMAQLREYIESGKDTSGKLAKYLEQTAQQGVDSYTGAVNVRIMQNFKIDTYVMSGSLIATSSPQCRFVFREWEGLIDRKDWPKLEDIADDNGLIEGTDFDNLPINKLHWGCRHEFTPLILTEDQKKKIKENPVNQPGEAPKKQEPKAQPKLQPLIPIIPEPVKVAEFKPDAKPIEPEDKKGLPPQDLSGPINKEVLYDKNERFQAEMDLKHYINRVKDKFPKLNDEEITAISMYGASDYHKINRYWRNPRKDDNGPYITELTKLINRGIAKLPNHVGTVIRGVHLDLEHVVRYDKAWRTGVPVEERAFTSTSKSADGAFGGNVQFVIKSKTGKGIEDITELQREREILFKAGSTFKVTLIETQVSIRGEDTVVIHMEEL